VNQAARVDRRTTLKWVLSASAALPLLKFAVPETSANEPSRAQGTSQGYGTDPHLMPVYRPGELWPLTLTAVERRTAAAVCDVIIPADAISPSASAVGVVDFIDEWISAPYPKQRHEGPMIVAGLAGLDREAMRQFGKAFADLDGAKQGALCDPICYVPKATPENHAAALFFARFRDLTAGAFYSTPEGTKDLGFVGNIALSRFEGPPPEVLKQAGLA